MKNLIIYTITLVAFLSSCDDVLLEEEAPNNPVSNFETMWKEFDEKYGLFEIKNINWDNVYDIYRPQINNYSSDNELYEVLTSMLDILNDNHVGIVPVTNPELPRYVSGIMGKMDTINDFNLEIVKQNYLDNADFEDPFFTYGYVTPDIGYIHIEGVSDMPRYLKKPIKNLLEEFKNSKALILDIRAGYGGEDLASQFIAGHFAKEKTLFMKNRIKNGPGKNDFTNWEEWYVEPQGDFQYTKPVVVLTHRFTISAKEVFCLAMKQLTNVTFVGDTTAGSFSNQINRELPNGWGYSVSIGQWVNANEESYEGIGLAPDIVIQNKKSDVLNGKDEALEKAIDILNGD